jgi:hypothetical protein
VIKPNIGFTVLNASEKAYFNMGLEAQLNVKRILTLYVNGSLDEGLWRNRAGLQLNMRVLELDIEAGMQSQSFTGAWSMKGASLGLGLKFGF